MTMTSGSTLRRVQRTTPLPTFLVCLCILFSTPLSASHAQNSPVDQGSVLIGGNASLTSTAIDSDVTTDGRTTQFILNPTSQYLIIPGVAVGGDVLFGYASDDNASVTRYGIGPAVTYFFGRGERSIYPFLSGSVGIIRARGANLDASRTQTSYRGAGGVLLKLTRSVGITGEFFVQQTDDGRLRTSTFGLAFGVSAFVF